MTMTKPNKRKTAPFPTPKRYRAATQSNPQRGKLDAAVRQLNSLFAKDERPVRLTVALPPRCQHGEIEVIRHGITLQPIPVFIRAGAAIEIGTVSKTLIFLSGDAAIVRLADALLNAIDEVVAFSMSNKEVGGAKN